MPSNLPDPSKIPDMSLDDRSDAPAPPANPDPATAFQSPPRNDAVTPVGYAVSVPESGGMPPMYPARDADAPADWREGDRVLAPWEPTFLYSGTIKQIKLDDAKGDQALIEFDDGDDGWVFLYSICPLTISEGKKVLSRRNMGPIFHPAEILEINGEEVRVGFEQGGYEWTTVAALRIPCVENGPGAVGTKFGANRPPEMLGQQGAGIPSWVIWIGVSILLAFIRIGCRAMNHN